MKIIMLLLGLSCIAAAPAWAQGQDSTPWERDLQVVRTLLVGNFDNANQSYFDRRADRPREASTAACRCPVA